MADKNYTLFEKERCRLCGECLSRCPMLYLEIDDAKKERKRILEGTISNKVSKRCTSCFNCDFYCPNQANPCEAILTEWNRDYLKKGLKERARYFIPIEPFNFRTYVLERLEEEEKNLVKTWDNTSPAEKILYPGCNGLTVPYLTKTEILNGMEIRGGLDWCCGEMLLRMGLFDEFKAQGEKMKARFEKMGLKKILMMCTAGTAIFTKILPEKFGVKFNLEFKPLMRWLLEKIEAKEIELTKKLNYSATIQDSCYSKFLEPDYVELPRKILEKLGIKITEMRHSKLNMICCGIGAGFSIKSNYHPADITTLTIKRLNEARKTKADLLVTYCAGCLQMLSLGRIFFPFSPPVYHILELVQIAKGEKPLRRINERVKLILRGVIRNQFPKVISKKTFFIKTMD